MPELPTFTVTAAQAQRLLAVFGSAAEYKAWLRQQIKAKVIEHESAQAIDAYQAQRKQIDEEVSQILPEPTPPAEEPPV